jgi:hypothetical protein
LYLSPTDKKDMARPIREVGPGRLEVRQGGGGLAVFGLPFLVAGIYVSLNSLGLFPLQDPGKPLHLLIGVVFTAIGGVLVFGRSWTTFDATARTIVMQMGLVVPMWTRTHRLDDYTSVLLDFQRGDSDSADQFPVSLTARAGGNLRLFSSTKYAESRQRATSVANLFRFDIEDRSTDHPLRLSAAQADLSLQHRMRMEHQRAEPVTRPANMRSEISATNGAVRIVMPRRRMHPIWFLFFLVPVAVSMFILAEFVRFPRQPNQPNGISWFFPGFLIVSFALLPLLAGLREFLGARLGRTIVTASTRGIGIEERRLWKTRRVAAFDAADIMDLDYSTTGTLLVATRRNYVGRLAQEGQIGARTDALDPRMEWVLGMVSGLVSRSAVTIKTRTGLTNFGEGLDDDEIRYLHAVVRRALVDGSIPDVPVC